MRDHTKAFPMFLASAGIEISVWHIFQPSNPIRCIVFTPAHLHDINNETVKQDRTKCPLSELEDTNNTTYLAETNYTRRT